MDFKKICSLSLSVLISFTLVACSNENLSKSEGAELGNQGANNTQSVKANSEETNNESNGEVAEEYSSLKFNNYEDVLNFYKDSGERISKLLSSNNIDHTKSATSAFITSDKKDYVQFEKNYEQYFVSDTRIHYGEGVGYFNITMEKEFHIDLEPTLDDSYINVMATLYKERFKDSIDENFMNELSNIIEEAKSTGYTTEIISDSSDFIIKATIDGSTVELFLNYDKPIQMAQPVEAIVNEIPTVAEFNDRNLQLSYHGRYSDPYKNLENVKIDDSKWQHVYGIDYSQNDTDSFSEELTFEFYTANLDKEYEGIDYEHSIEDPVYEANEETITYFSKALDIFSETLGFDIKDYMTTEQILEEFQTINMRNNCEFIGFTSQSINDSLPIPGFTYSFVKTDSIYEFAGIYENSMKLYELDENEYSNKTAYEITFKIHRPVVAEGITRK